MKKKIIWITSSLVLIYFILIGYTAIVQEKKIFNPRKLSDDYPISYKIDFEEHVFAVDQETKIHAVEFIAEDPKGMVLYFHGRGCHLGQRWEAVVENFTKRGYSVLMCDYRGFGKSRGKITEKGVLSDAKMLYEYVWERFSEEKIIVYGRSLGTGIATYVASEYHPKMLILEAPYYSILELASSELRWIPGFIVKSLLKYHFRTDLWIQKVKAPIFLFHGTHDQTIPFQSSKRLEKLATSSKNLQLTALSKATHDRTYEHPSYMQKLNHILGSTIPAK